MEQALTRSFVVKETLVREVRWWVLNRKKICESYYTCRNQDSRHKRPPKLVPG